MTCEAKTPTAARERRGYLRRACAVMLACVLCFCLVRPPRAQAVVVEAGLVVAGSVAVAPIAATIGLIALAAVGVTFAQGFFEAENGVPFYGSRAYDAGYQLHQYLQSDEVSESVRSWSSSIVAQYEAEGKILAGDSFTIPAEVAEVARQWAVQHYDFSSGSVALNQQGIILADGSMVAFSQPYSASWVSLSYVGTVFPFGSTLDFGAAGVVTSDGTYRITGPFNTATYGKNQGAGVTVQGLTLSYNAGRVYVGLFLSDGLCNFGAYVEDADIADVNCALSGTEALTVPISETKEITIPEMPLTDVDTDAGVITIPVVGTLTAEDVLTGATDVPIDPPIVGDKTMVGDVALEDVATAQGGLGAIFIQKFPFCIPWDLAKAVGLLAAPPKTPYWEVDFMAPISGRVGGWRGDTSITIDMADYEIVGTVCRWTSTIMFCFALIGATKRLIWTA